MNKKRYRRWLRLGRILFALLFHPTYQRDKKIKELTGPTIICGNHCSFLDPGFMALAVPDKEIHFLAGEFLFKKPKLQKILKDMGVISKIQFYVDAMAVKNMIKVLREGGTVGFYPEGQRCVAGETMPIDSTSAKFAKKMKANLVFVKLHGAYFMWPRWSYHIFRPGKVEVTTSVLFTKEEIVNTEVAVIDQCIQEQLRYNDYHWQATQKKPWKYLTFHPARDMENICHKCPACKKDLVIKSSARKLACQKCDFEIKVLRTGFFKKEKQVAPIFSNLLEWKKWQYEEMKSQLLQKESLHLEFPCELENSFRKNDELKKGQGLLSMNEACFSFKGELAGQAIELEFPLELERELYADYGQSIQLITEDEIYKFKIKPKQAVILFSDLFYNLREKMQNENKV